jgi:hypothetical protein
MYIKRLLKILFKKLFKFLSFKVLKFIVDPIPTPQYRESGTPRLTDAGSRGVYKRKNKSLRSLCMPVVAGISGPAKHACAKKTVHCKSFS